MASRELGNPLGNQLVLPRSASATPDLKPNVILSTFGSFAGSLSSSLAKPSSATCAQLKIHDRVSNQAAGFVFEMYLRDSNQTLAHSFCRSSAVSTVLSNVTGNLSSVSIATNQSVSVDVLYSINYFDNLDVLYTPITVGTVPTKVSFSDSDYKVSLVFPVTSNFSTGTGGASQRFVLEKGRPSSFVFYLYKNGAVDIMVCIFDGEFLYRTTDYSNVDFYATLERVYFI